MHVGLVDQFYDVGFELGECLDDSRCFVGGLPEDFTDDDLTEHFKPFGKITGANLLPAKGSSRKRCGFVNFSLWGEALDAVEALDDTVFRGDRDEEPLTVVIAEPPRKESGSGGHRASDYDTGRSSKSRRTSYADDAPSRAGWAPTSKYESLKAAYLAAVDSGSPEEVCAELHFSLMRSRPNVASTRSPPRVSRPVGGRNDRDVDDPDSARLFIGGLPNESTDHDLRLLVGQLQFRVRPKDCQLLECRVLEGRGCGYIRFSSWEAAEEAMEITSPCHF